MKKKRSSSGAERTTLFTKIAVFCFKNWQATVLVWIVLLGFGVQTYTNTIPREGFPPIQFPLSFVSGPYFVDDKDKVDKDVTQPLQKLLQGLDGIESISTTANENFFSSAVFFESDVLPQDGEKAVKDALANDTTLPEQVRAQIDVLSIDPAAFLNEYDMLLAVYSTDASTPVASLENVASFVAQDFANDPKVASAEVQTLLQTAPNPITGLNETRQTAFNQIGLNEGDAASFYQAVVVGVDRVKDTTDIIELSDAAKARIAGLDLAQFGPEYKVVIGADFAESITTQISSLEGNLLTGLLAVALVSFLLITWRAALVTGIFMVTVMAITIITLYLIGYSLNTITLFGLVLSLGLFVDDATIVVESIDASRRKKRNNLEVVAEAVKRVGAASFAGTATTALVFLPLAFLTGILGEFIRLMPVTIIIALITSLVLSLTLIPVLSKYFLLRTTDVDAITKINPITKLEAYLAQKAGNLPRLLLTRHKVGIVVALLMIGLSGLFVAGAGVFGSKISFNIFPPSKDSDQIGFEIQYPPNYTIIEAEKTASQINTIVAEEFGPLVKKVTYGSFQQPNNRSADALIELTPFNEREEKSPELIARLQKAIDTKITDGSAVRVIQYDAGPPASEFPLQLQINEEDLQKSIGLAQEVQQHIQGATLTRANGTTATIDETRAPSLQSVNRIDGVRTLTVEGRFSADDTSALLVAAETYVREKFTTEYLASKGFSENAIGFDFGQESSNADSFASLAYAFPLALLLMYVLLAVQFKSLLQPVLIFMAIPFTFFGVFAGLYATDNALSFFVQVGLIGLIGIAVNNTILLTDYANQEKQAGFGSIEAISHAVTKRFRPLITTTLTTVVALLPLALTDPFWEALAFTILFGLLSSTFLVVVSFPYYYLAAEWIRHRFNKRVVRIVRTLRKSA